MKNASTITAFIISFLVVGSLALVFLFLDNKEEEPAAAEPAAQTEVPARQTVTPQPTVDPLTKEDISRQTATPPSLINLSSPQTLAQAIAKVIQDRDEDILKSLEIQQAVTENPPYTPFLSRHHQHRREQPGGQSHSQIHAQFQQRRARLPGYEAQ